MERLEDGPTYKAFLAEQALTNYDGHQKDSKLAADQQNAKAVADKRIADSLEKSQPYFLANISKANQGQDENTSRSN